MADFDIFVEQGRSELRKLAPIFSISAGDSVYNASELERWGFNKPWVLPIAVSPDKWDNPPDSGLMRCLQDGKTNLIYIGRVAPDKCIAHLISGFFHYLDMDPDARLIIVEKIKFLVNNILRRRARCRAVVSNFPGNVDQR